MKAVILGCGRVGASEIGYNLTKALRAEVLIAITRPGQGPGADAPREGKRAEEDPVGSAT